MLLGRIELFVNAAKFQNLSKTARALRVSPSSITQRLKWLEIDLGAKLYKRKKDGIELTDAGRILLSTAGQILDQLDTLRKTINPNAEKVVKPLVIGASQSPSAYYLPAAVARFQKTHPNIKVTLLTSHVQAVEKWLRDGEVDIAMIQSPSKFASGEFFVDYFASDIMVFFAHAGHPLTKKPAINFKDLADSPLVVREGKGSTHKALELLQSRGLKLNIALRCDSLEAVKVAVQNKIGVGILFRNMIKNDLRSNGLKILRVAGLPRVIGKTYLVYSRTRPLAGPASEFRSMVLDSKSRKKKLVNIRNASATVQSRSLPGF